MVIHLSIFPIFAMTYVKTQECGFMSGIISLPYHHFVKLKVCLSHNHIISLASSAKLNASHAEIHKLATS